MKLSYKDLRDDQVQRLEVKAELTTEHPDGSCGQPVVVLEHGGALDLTSWVSRDYQVEEATKAELDQLLKMGIPALERGQPCSKRSMRTKEFCMKIIALEYNAQEEWYRGFFELDTVYQQFAFADDRAEFLDAHLIKDYRDYEHFADVMGKFDPSTFFLKKPIEIEGLTLEELKRVWGEMVKTGIEAAGSASKRMKRLS